MTRWWKGCEHYSTCKRADLNDGVAVRLELAALTFVDEMERRRETQRRVGAADEGTESGGRKGVLW